MKTICTLGGKIVMSQDGDNESIMTANAAQYPGAVVSVVTNEEYLLLSVDPPSKEQRRRQILDSVGCFNLIHLEKDWALLESERQRLGITEAQAYIDNVTYRALSDARTALAAIDAE